MIQFHIFRLNEYCSTNIMKVFCNSSTSFFAHGWETKGLNAGYIVKKPNTDIVLTCLKQGCHFTSNKLIVIWKTAVKFNLAALWWNSNVSLVLVFVLANKILTGTRSGRCMYFGLISFIKRWFHAFVFSQDINMWSQTVGRPYGQG